MSGLDARGRGRPVPASIAHAHLIVLQYRVQFTLLVAMPALSNLNAFELDVQFPIHLVTRTDPTATLAQCLHDPITRYSRSSSVGHAPESGGAPRWLGSAISEAAEQEGAERNA